MYGYVEQIIDFMFTCLDQGRGHHLDYALSVPRSILFCIARPALSQVEILLAHFALYVSTLLLEHVWPSRS